MSFFSSSVHQLIKYISMAEHNNLGKRGEELAACYLEKKGYRILEKNWRLWRNEIDVVATDGKYLVIVEVKTRQSNFFGEPETAVTLDKQKALIRAANAYVRYTNIHCEVRFDILSVIISKNTEQIHHIEDAFYPIL
jgi:putative endonuclease